MPRWLPIRDELFLLAHDEERDFRLRVHLPTLNLGLAGATLIDLLILNRVHICDHRIVISDPYNRNLVGDSMADQILTTIRSMTRPHPPIQDFLTTLAPDMYDRTLGGLIAAGVLARNKRRLGRTYHRISDPAVITHTRGRLRAAVQGSLDYNPATDSLCILIRILGLHNALYLSGLNEVDEALHEITTRMHHLVSGPLTGVPHITEAVDRATDDLAVAVYR